MFPKMPGTPFAQRRKCPDLNGVYRSTDSGHIHVVKNVHLNEYVSLDGKERYAGYTCSIKSTDPEIGEHRRIGLTDVPWEFLLPL